MGSTKVQQWLKHAKSRGMFGRPWTNTTGQEMDSSDLAEKAELPGLQHWFDEAEAIRMATRRDLFKFTIVRNPFVRAVSAYLDKHVRGGEQKSRAYWNQVGRGYAAES